MPEYIEDIIFNEEENAETYSLFNDSVYSYSKQTKIEFDTIFPTEYKKFTEENYKTLNNNLILYKTGNAEAAQYIISMFHRFIKKYTDFICYGYYTNIQEYETKEYNSKFKRPYDKSLTRFISLFISKSDREQAKNATEKGALFSEACIKIQRLFSKFEYWDIYNELVCTLLNMANKYKVTKEGDEYHKENGTFHMYVNKCFHFDAYNTLTKIIGDPLAHFEVYGIEDEFSFEYTKDTICNVPRSYNSEITAIDKAGMRVILRDMDTDKILEKMIIKTDRQSKLDSCKNTITLKEDTPIDPYEMESLNFNWTNGNTCSEVFQCLTSYERELILMSFVQHKTDVEIASIYGCHRITIVKHKKIAVNKIREYIKNNK